MNDAMGGTLALVIVAVAGCGDDAAMPDGGGSGQPDAPALSCGTGEYAWSMTVRDGSFTGPALAGAHVCAVHGTSSVCTDTGIDGTWSFCVPTNTEFEVMLSKAGYMPSAGGWTSGDAQPSVPRALAVPLIASTAACENTWTPAGYTCPPSGEGFVWIQAFGSDTSDTPLAGVQLTGFDPVTAKSPYYLDSSGKYSSTLTATSSNGSALVGGLPDGTNAITVEMTGKICHARPFQAWPGATSTVRVPIHVGYRSYAQVTCE